MKIMHCVILAGGSGTRFWPRSRQNLPKQLLPIAGSQTLIQQTVNRLKPLGSPDSLWAVTREEHAFETCRQLERFDFQPCNLIAEPVGRNTAAAIGLVAAILAEDNPDTLMAVFPADHIIQNEDQFGELIRSAESVAREGYLVTLGIHPDRPETGYGYIKQGPAMEKHPGAFQVERFVEKPDAATAKRFFQQGGYYWNSGMFFWKASALLAEFKTHLPDHYEKLNTLVSHLEDKKGKYPYRILDSDGTEVFESLQSISIDYGVMEKSKHTAVIPANLQWSDVGSWTALEDVSPRDPAGNVTQGDVLSIDCTDSVIQGDKRLIAALGLKDLIVVDTPDALLVSARDRAQDIKKIVAQLREKKRPEATTPSTVHRPWGNFTVIDTGTNHKVKRLEVLPGEKLSLQSHNHRTEHWTVVAGKAEVIRNDEAHNLEANDSITIPVGAKHRLGNPGSTSLVIIEVQWGDRVDEDDIIRYDDIYGRRNPGT